MSLPLLTQIAALGAFVALMAWGAFTDFTRLIIPNRVCLAIVALYPAYVIASGGTVDWLEALALAGTVFGVGVVLFALRMTGGGDVKFMSAVVLWVGPPLFWPFIVVTGLVGGVMGLALAINHRYWRTLAVRIVGLTTGAREEALPQAMHIPYGVAIAAGGCFAALRLAMP